MPGRFARLLLMMGACAPLAFASSYLYTFSASQIVAGLQSVDPNFSTHGYYDLFAQPSLSNFTIVALNDPYHTSNSDWGSGTGQPNENHNGVWAQFYVNDSSSLADVSVIGTNPSLVGQYYYPTYGSGCNYPGCWSNGHTIGALLNGGSGVNASFTILISTTDPVALGLVRWTWYGEVAVNYPDGSKVMGGYNFTIMSQGQALASEPSCFALLGVALAAVYWRKARKPGKKRQ